jgi:hypothetical protein
MSDEGLGYQPDTEGTVVNSVPLEGTARSPEAIQSDLSVLIANKNRTEEATESALESATENISDKQKGDAVGFFYSLLEAGERKEPFSNIPVPEGVSESLADSIRNGAENIMSASDRVEELEGEYLPYRRAELAEIVSSLSSHLDYEAMFNYYFQKGALSLSNRDEEDPGSINNARSEMLFLLKVQHDIAVGDASLEAYSYVDGVATTLSDLGDKWSSKGYLSEQYLRDPFIGELINAESSAQEQDLARDIEQAVQVLRAYDRLADTYKFFSGIRHVSSEFQLVTLESVILNKIAYYANDSEVVKSLPSPPDFLAAARGVLTRITKRSEELGRLSRSTETLANLDQARDERIKQMPDISIEGFEVPEGMDALFTPDEIKSQIERAIPIDFLQELRRIHHQPSRLVEEKGGHSIITHGDYFSVMGEGEDWDGLKEAYISVYRKLFVEKDLDSPTVEYLKEKFVGTVWHEIGHNVQSLLSYDEMVGWEEVLASDQTALSGYVTRSRAENTGLGKREDFSETFRVFLENPNGLSIQSPARYQYMRNLFISHLPSSDSRRFEEELGAEVQSNRNLWQSLGINQEDVDQWLAQ